MLRTVIPRCARSPRSIARLAAATILLTATAACGGGGGDGGGDGTGQVGQPLPAVDIVPLDGGDPIALDAIDGPAVVNLWATWCVPCRTEIPAFEEVHQQRGDTVRFVGVNIGQTSDEAHEFLDEVGASYEQYLDVEGFAQTELAATLLPTTVVIDADGIITTRQIGTMDQDALDAAIDDALAG